MIVSTVITPRHDHVYRRYNKHYITGNGKHIIFFVMNVYHTMGFRFLLVQPVPILREIHHHKFWRHYLHPPLFTLSPLQIYSTATRVKTSQMGSEIRDLFISSWHESFINSIISSRPGNAHIHQWNWQSSSWASAHICDVTYWSENTVCPFQLSIWRKSDVVDVFSITIFRSPWNFIVKGVSLQASQPDGNDRYAVASQRTVAMKYISYMSETNLKNSNIAKFNSSITSIPVAKSVCLFDTNLLSEPMSIVHRRKTCNMFRANLSV